jgi:hypothetical protein
VRREIVRERSEHWKTRRLDIEDPVQGLSPERMPYEARCVLARWSPAYGGVKLKFTTGTA